MSEQQLIQKCLNKDHKAQNALYHQFAPRMFPVCQRYAKSYCDAEDIMQDGFVKVFRYLADFQFNGSFEGWMRKIMVTTALNFYKRKRIYQNEAELNYQPEAAVSEQHVYSSLVQEELLTLVKKLPNGYQTVFSLNSIEGYTHKEISELLKISVNTSKSQLNRARQSLQKQLFYINQYSDPDKQLQSA
jgi:RNA polymerase sigma-70 factor (ECF subfamily)